MRRLRCVLLALACALAAAPAAAHAVLVEAQPADGAVLAAAPKEVRLRFNEPVAPIAVRVLDAGARRIADGAGLEARDDTLRLPLPPGLPAGTYVVSYRVISADSHPVAGSLTFSIGAPVVAPAPLPAAGPGWTVAYAGLRAAFMAGLLVAAGGVWALALLAGFSRATRADIRCIAAAAAAALALALPLLGAKGAQLAAAGPGGVLSAAAWQLALSSTLATSVAVAALGLALILVSLLRLRAAAGQGVALIGGLVAVGSFALTGHAATALPRGLALAALMLHAGCAAFWLGALRPLLSALREPAAEARRLVARFSAQAVVSVALLLAAGAALAVLQMRHWGMLWQSAYGLVLSAKLAAVALLLALAACNKWVLTPRLAAGPRGLRAAILAEYALFAAILALTAALTQLEPPRAILERDNRALDAAQAGFSATRGAGDYRVTLSASPARVGANTLGVTVARADGAPAAPKEVDLDLSLPAAGIEPLRRQTERDAPGRFVYHGKDLAVAGRWRVDVRVLIDDFTEVTVTFELPIR